MTFELGDYRAIEVVGAGASAQVWRGVHARTGAAVALKVFPADHLATARREAALASAVDHPHVVRVIDVVGDAERCALVTEFAAGGDLAGLLAVRARLSVGETLTVLLPLAAALATAHERDIVHGDLSAGNVLFDLAGRPMLADLGAGRAAAEVGVPVSATPVDAAPELARGAAPSPASDMFSLGSLALACLTGRHAWPADDLHDVLIQAAGGQWPDPGDDVAPPGLTSVVRALLEHDPERRPGAASVVMDLRAVGRPVPIDLRRSAPSGEPGAPSGAVVIGASDGSPRHGAPPEADPLPIAGPVPGGRPRADHDPDRLIRARAVTRARADAVPHPEPEEQSGRFRRLLRSRADDAPRRPGDRRPNPAGRPSATGGRSRTVRVTLIAVVCVLVTGAAAAAGLWWAGLDRNDPAVASGATSSVVSGSGVTSGAATTTASTRVATPNGPNGPTTGSTAASTGSTVAEPTSSPASSSPTRSTSSTSSSTSTAGTRPTATVSSTAGTRPAPVDWTATVAALDDARAKAVTARNVAMLDAVYTAGSAARAADATMIRQLISRGLRVSGAQHRVATATVIGLAPIKVRVKDALPSYSVLNGDGKVIGTTSARPSAARTLVLVATTAGYRISAVESG